MKFYKKDWFLRVASLVAAVLIWFYVVYQENPTIDSWLTKLPIAQQNLSDDFVNGKLVIMSVSAENADVKVSGRRRMVSSANASTGTAYMDMSKIKKEGEYHIPINVNFTLDGLDVVQIRPSHCTVVVDRVVTEERTIEITTKGEATAGFDVDKISLNPSVIKLTGPQTLVSAVKHCEIAVDVTDASEDIKGLYKVKLYDERNQEITGTDIAKNIEYTDVYCSVSATKDIEVKPNLSSNINLNGDRVNAVCEPSSIRVIGKTNAMDSVTEVLTPLIDVSEIYESTTEEMELNLPDGLFFADESNKTVKVKITVAKTEPEPEPEEDE